MSIYEKLEEELKDSFAYTLHDKLIFITGFLVDDDENEDLLNFVNYLLYSENDFTITPKLDFSGLNTWSTVNQWQWDNPLLDKTFANSLKESFNKKE